MPQLKEVKDFLHECGSENFVAEVAEIEQAFEEFIREINLSLLALKKSLVTSLYAIHESNLQLRDTISKLLADAFDLTPLREALFRVTQTQDGTEEM